MHRMDLAATFEIMKPSFLLTDASQEKDSWLLQPNPAPPPTSGTSIPVVRYVFQPLQTALLKARWAMLFWNTSSEAGEALSAALASWRPVDEDRGEMMS